MLCSYCKQNSIDLLTTMDLVEWAYENELWTEKECDAFITLVLKKGSKLPTKTIRSYIDRKK